MSRTLRILIVCTDILFVAYWLLAALAALEVVRVPEAFMYRDHKIARVVAWNWSFFPLDMSFSIFGFLSLRAFRRNDPCWRQLAIVSLTLTSTAGAMAVSYWTLLREFDLSWFVPNLLLMLWPWFFLRALIFEPGVEVQS